MRLEVRSGRIAYHGIRMAIAASPLPREQWPAAALYLLVTTCNLPGALAAEIYGCTKQNVSKHLRAVEDRREDLVIDAALCAIERQLMGEDEWTR